MKQTRCTPDGRLIEVEMPEPLTEKALTDAILNRDRSKDHLYKPATVTDEHGRTRYRDNIGLGPLY